MNTTATEISVFLNLIIDDGIKAVTASYEAGPKFDGAIHGFETCRGKTPEQMVVMWKRASDLLHTLMDADNLDEFWYWNCYQSEVEWVLNCLSVALNRPLLGHLPTARGALKVSEILSMRTTVA